MIFISEQRTEHNIVKLILTMMLGILLKSVLKSLQTSCVTGVKYKLFYCDKHQMSYLCY